MPKFWINRYRIVEVRYSLEAPDPESALDRVLSGAVEPLDEQEAGWTEEVLVGDASGSSFVLILDDADD